MKITKEKRRKIIEQRVRRYIELNKRYRELENELDEIDEIEYEQIQLESLLYEHRPDDYIEDVKAVLKKMGKEAELKDGVHDLEEEIDMQQEARTKYGLAEKIKYSEPEQKKMLLGEIEEPE